MHENPESYLFISELPEVKKAGLRHFSQLTGGKTNTSWKVQTDKGTWVVRKNADQVIGVNRKLEARILEQIAPLNITPKLIAAKPEEGYLITEFIEGEAWTQSDCNNSERLQILFDAVKKVHAITIKEPVTCIKFRLYEYLNLSADNVRKSLQLDVEKLLKDVNQLGFFEQQKLCHFDLNHNNLIGVDSIKILDWEFVGMAHPILDYAILSLNEKVPMDLIIDVLLYNHQDIELFCKVRELAGKMIQTWHALQ